MGTGSKFPMAQEIYNRVRWDPGLDASVFVIGWATRDGRIKETALLAWKDGEVPWHRARYIKAGEQVVWDREARVDLVTSGEMSGGDASARGVVWSEEVGAWSEGVPSGSMERESGELVVATWNVLARRWAPRIAREDDMRATKLAEAVSMLGAHVIALQEVDRETLEALRAHEEIRAFYAMSAGLDEDDDVDRHGVLLLSSLPMTYRIHAFGQDKAAVVAQIEVGAKALRVVCVHLTSDRARDAERKRRAQMEDVLELTQSADEVLVLGDFNSPGDALADLHEAAGYEDAWLALREGEHGYTYSPRVNRLANLTTTSGRERRLDRMLWRSRGGALEPIEVDVRSEGVGAISDHDALVCLYNLGKRACQYAVADHGAALVWLPDEADVAALGPIREAHDPKASRWPAHVTLLHPFVGHAHHAEAAEVLAHALSVQDAADVVVHGIGTFTSQRSDVAWVGIEDDGALGQLRASAAKLFRHCASFQDYTPHLTVGRGEGARAALREASELAPVSSRIHELALMRMGEGGVFEVSRRIPLGGHGVLDGALAAKGLLAGEEEDALVARIEEVLGPMTPVGSSGVGTRVRGSDIDLLHTCDAPSEELARGAKFARGAHGFDVVVKVDGAVSTLRLLVDGRRVDVTYARSARTDPSGLARALRDAARAHGALDAWAEATRFMKAWAMRRSIYGAAFGAWGGAAWATVCAYEVASSAREGHRLTGAAIVRRLFARLADWSWPAPVSLTGDAAPRSSGPMPVLNPVDPSEDLSRAMTDGVAEALQLELMGAAEALEQGASFTELLEPVGLGSSGILVRLSAPSGADLARLDGWFTGRLAHLLHQLGDDDPRPHTQPSEVDGGLEYRFEIHPFSRARRAAEKVSSLLTVPVEIGGGRVEVDAWRR